MKALQNVLRKVGSVEDDAHQAAGKRSNDWDSEDPTKEDPAKSAPVDRAQVTIAQRNTHGSTSNAHGSGYGETILRGKDNGDGSAKFHGETTRGGVEGDLVTEDLHDVVTIGSETENNHGTTEGEGPDGNGGLG